MTGQGQVLSILCRFVALAPLSADPIELTATTTAKKGWLGLGSLAKLSSVSEAIPITATYAADT
jgi:hypothetical protein